MGTWIVWLLLLRWSRLRALLARVPYPFASWLSLPFRALHAWPRGVGARARRPAHLAPASAR